MIDRKETLILSCTNAVMVIDSCGTLLACYASRRVNWREEFVVVFVAL